MLVVTKFGGSSLSCATQFEKVKNIIESDAKRKIVVVSALGKRDPKDTKITDLLYILHAHLRYSVPYEEIWTMIVERFCAIRKDLAIAYPIEEDLSSLSEELHKGIALDYLVSRGEYFTAKLMSSYLGYPFVDAKEIIRFGYDGKLDESETEKAVKQAFMRYGSMVVPGFYGAYPDGSIKLLSRGGSDVTGSILSKCLKVSLYENWTDVSGILAADPRIIFQPKCIREITYAELRELSYMGANVLHEETVFPVQELNIPINLKNTNDPQHPGTLIKNECEDQDTIVTGLAGKKEFMAFNIFKTHMSNQVGFQRKTLSIFEKYGVSVEHLPSGIDSFSVVVSDDSAEQCQYEIIMDLKKELNADVTVDHDLALIAVVGRNMVHKYGLCGTIFQTLGKEKINIKLLAQGPSELNIIIGIARKDYENSLRALYKNLLA